MAQQGDGTSRTLRRIFIELAEIKATPSAFWTANPLSEEEPYEWHFTLQGPPGTDFQGGLYHGKFTLPMNYPFAPPSIALLTPNGRFEEGKKICLSISNFHPELWQPAWGIRTMMEALRSFFPTPAEGAVGGLDWPAEVRRILAQESLSWACPQCKRSNSELLQPAPDATAVVVEASKEQSSSPELEVSPQSPRSAASPTVAEPVNRSVLAQLLNSLGPLGGKTCMTLITDIHIAALGIFAAWVFSDILINPPRK